MLRVIIYLKPEIEKNIINFRKTKVNFREKLLEDQKMDIDQSIIIFTITDSFRIFEAITTGQKSLKKLFWYFFRYFLTINIYNYIKIIFIHFLMLSFEKFQKSFFGTS